MAFLHNHTSQLSQNNIFQWKCNELYIAIINTRCARLLKRFIIRTYLHFIDLKGVDVIAVTFAPLPEIDTPT
jgi:hypothetical protein